MAQSSLLVGTPDVRLVRFHPHTTKQNMPEALRFTIEDGMLINRMFQCEGTQPPGKYNENFDVVKFFFHASKQRSTFLIL